MIAALFPGHGAEFPRMGLALAEQDPEAAALLAFAGDCAGVDARAVLRRGGDRLADTAVLQPLMTAVSLGVVAALARRGVVPDVALGHSLGELAAWSALGGVSARAVIELAALRGRCYATITAAMASRGAPGDMLALPSLDRATLEALVARGRDRDPKLAIAAHNGPGRWVLAGEREVLLTLAAEVGGVLLGTGPWHSPHLSPARAEWLAALRACSIAPTPGLIVNQDGAWLGDRAVAPLIAGQVDEPVCFAAGLATLRGQDDRAALILVASAKVLRGLIRDNGWSDARCFPAETPADLDRIAADLEGTAGGLERPGHDGHDREVQA